MPIYEAIRSIKIVAKAGRPRNAIRKSPVPRWWTEVSLRTSRRPTPAMAACTCKDNLGRTTAQGNFLVSLSSYMPEYPDDFLFSYLITAEVSHRYSGRKLHYWDHEIGRAHV